MTILSAASRFLWCSSRAASSSITPNTSYIRSSSSAVHPSISLGVKLLAIAARSPRRAFVKAVFARVLSRRPATTSISLLSLSSSSFAGFGVTPGSRLLCTGHLKIWRPIEMHPHAPLKITSNHRCQENRDLVSAGDRQAKSSNKNLKTMFFSISKSDKRKKREREACTR